MSTVDSGSALLEELARKYIWWKLPENAPPSDHRVVAQVMNIGDYQDVLRMIEVLGEPKLRSVLAAVLGATVLQDAIDTWVVLVQGTEGPPVKLSFFGSIGFGRIGATFICCPSRIASD